MPHPVRHISVAIARPFAEVYAFLAEPENFPKWASGLGSGLKHLGGADWLVETQEGPIKMRFSARNDYGVLDHTLFPEGGEPIHNPMRVVPNGDGCEVTFTLFRRPEMSDADFERDAEWVKRDLEGLKGMLKR